MVAKASLLVKHKAHVVVRVLEGAWGDVPDKRYEVTRPFIQFHRQDHYLYVSDAFCTNYRMSTKASIFEFTVKIGLRRNGRALRAS